MSDRIKKHWPILFLGILVILYFGFILFFPQPKIFFNPDYGLSDVTHFNLPMRKLLHDSLQNFQLPLWSQEIGAGFPIFAEGQSGDLSILNLTTAWLPAWLSFNLSYIFAFLLMSIFTYLFCREIGLSKISSILSAMVFTWGGSNWAHFNHLNQLVTVAWIPVEFYLLERAIKSASGNLSVSGGWWLFLAFAISQQIFGGKLQFVVYSLVALGLYLVFKIWLVGEFSGNVSRRRALLSQLFLFVFSVVLAVGLGAIQFLPSLELTQLSLRAGGLPFEQATQYPYPVKHLATFLNPYLQGDPRNGTYPQFSENWGLFWENTAYIGIVPLLLVFVSIGYLIVRGFRFLLKRRSRIEDGRSNLEDQGWRVEGLSIFDLLSSNIHLRPSTLYLLFFLLLAIFYLLLSFGKSSPLSFVFNFPPLNYFRVPSRMLTMVNFSLAMVAAFGLEIITQWSARRFGPIRVNSGKLVASVLVVLTLFDLFYFSSTYSPIIETSKYLDEPQIVKLLKQDNSQFRIFSVGVGSIILWNRILLGTGWQDQDECYLVLRETLFPNLNLLWRIEAFGSYTGITPQDQVSLSEVVGAGILWDGKETVHLTEAVVKILGFYNIKYLISPFDLVSPLLTRVKEINLGRLAKDRCSSLGGVTLKIYQNTQNQPRIFMVDSISQNFARPLSTDSYQVFSQTLHDLEVSAKIRVERDGFLVLADSFYPGWKALVDGREKTIYKVNLNQRAVFLPTGNHEVKFVYQPNSFKIGLLVSGFSALIWGLVLAFYLLKKEEISSIKIQNKDINL